MRSVRTSTLLDTPASAQQPDPAAPPDRPAELSRSWRGGQLWHRLGLVAVLLLSAFLNLFHLDREGNGNQYYTAAVYSMLQSWHTFFFASFDPGGFVTVDKPPLGFWIQAASAKLLELLGFDFSGLSVLASSDVSPIGAPETLSGVLVGASGGTLKVFESGAMSDAQEYRILISTAAPTGLVASESTYLDRVHLFWATVPRTTQYQLWRSESNSRSVMAVSRTMREPQ